jgi:hypothetical protein
MIMEKFSQFVLNEERSYLGHRVSDVLTSLQDVQDDINDLGSRHLSRLAEGIVNQIRKIIHGRWNPKYKNQLKELQKVAVAIQKAVDEKGDLKQILPAAASTLANLSGKLGVKVNDLKAPEQEGEEGDIDPQDFQSTGSQPLQQADTVMQQEMPPQPEAPPQQQNPLA